MFNEFSESAGGSIPDLTVPSKEALIHLLRNEDKWPAGFEFYFQNCTRCAIGLAHKVWDKKIAYSNSDLVSDAIGISRKDGERIFMEGDGRLNRFEISARDVADMLEAV